MRRSANILHRERIITSSVHLYGHRVMHNVINRRSRKVAGKASVSQKDICVMVAAIFAVVFAGATAFAVLTIWYSIAPHTKWMAFLAAYSRHHDEYDWARVTYTPGPAFAPSPPPEFAVRSASPEAVPQVSIPRWQSWCRTGYVAPAAVAARWSRSPSRKRGNRCQSSWAPIPAGRLCDIMPDSHSRVAEPSDYAVRSSPPPHLSIGFLAAQPAAPRALGARQRLLA